MKNGIYLSFIIIMLSSFISCSSNGDKNSLFIFYSKSKCFGNCEVFNVQIYENGETIYEGIENVEMIGLYNSKLEEKDLIELKKQFLESNFMDLSNSYINKNIRDLPRLVLQLKSKKIEFQKRNAPKKLNELANLVESKLTNLSFETN